MNTFELDSNYIANTYARFPLELVSGKGCILKDKDGKEYQSYSVYTYHGDLLKDSDHTREGYLFIAEPIAGDREARLFYLSEEEFERMLV